jgi:nicotinamidase/pyrazinamidase
LNKTYSLTNIDALLITDIQNDFLSGGALPVPNGEQVIPILNEYARHFSRSGAHVLASRDWHPPNHMSFKAQGGQWPPHCVQNTSGAMFHKDLRLPEGTLVISKATNPKKEAYSAFDGTELADELQELGVKRFFVGGLATDYCVLNTVLDSIKLGFATVVLMDAVRGINVKPGDVDRAVAAMVKAGAEQAVTDNFPEPEETLPTDAAEADALEEKPAARVADKKKARLRPRDSRKKVAVER